MARNIRYRLPRSVQAVKTIEQLKDVVMDILYLMSEYREVITANYSITGEVANEHISSNATTAVTVTMRAEPEDGDEVSVSKDNTGNVTIDYNGKADTKGCTTLTLVGLGDSVHLEFNESTDKWRYM